MRLPTEKYRNLLSYNFQVFSREFHHVWKLAKGYLERLFTVILEAYDLVNQNEKYLIDRAIHRGLLRPLISSTKQSTDWHQVTISTQYSGYTFCIQLTCELNHYGNDCTKVCQTNDNHTKFKCDANGDKICEPGWSGTECDKAICNIGCHPVHGTCSRPGECE
ncbi:unnamed protein product [Schistosoma curassoni]|nr:unnamed protein product [Schistosoma curassoni]